LYFLQQDFFEASEPNTQAHPSKGFEAVIISWDVGFTDANITIYNDSKQYRKSGILFF